LIGLVLSSPMDFSSDFNEEKLSDMTLWGIHTQRGKERLRGIKKRRI
jgi:hypothetical protein